MSLLIFWRYYRLLPLHALARLSKPAALTEEALGLQLERLELELVGAEEDGAPRGERCVSNGRHDAFAAIIRS